MKRFFLSILTATSLGIWAQGTSIKVFENARVNFSEKGETDGIRLQSGRLIIKKVTAPKYRKGTDVSISVTVRSNGDRWDKSGSCFVINDPRLISVIDVAQGKKKFPATSAILNANGVVNTPEYQPAVELLRFMTPFGVGFYSDEKKFPKTRYSRPVTVPKWEDKVQWTQDISQLQSLLTGEFYVGVWIDTWTADGYLVDVTLNYSGRPLPSKTIVPLANTVYYASGQEIPDFFAKTTLKSNFSLPKNVKNADLYYITTGHGGHEGGDEFIKIKNTVLVDQKPVLSFIPWRDDCAAFRRFNPATGVWIQKDTAMYYNDNMEREKGVVVERLASSDLSRSNWCPGSCVVPEKIRLGDLQKGAHSFEVKIPATQNVDDQHNHWLVSAYLAY